MSLLSRLFGKAKPSQIAPDALEKVYRFRAQLKHRKSNWRVIEIKGDQTLGDLDAIMRETFNRDPWDHLSEFFPGEAHRSRGYGAINPFGGGPGGAKPIAALRLVPGGTLEYVYDFGDDIQHVLTLEEIVDPESDAPYPRVVARSQPGTRKKGAPKA